MGDVILIGMPPREDIDTVRAERDALQVQLAEARGQLDEIRRHPCAPEKCPECAWTNINLMNYGLPGKPRWACHGCAARLISEHSSLAASLAAMTAERDALQDRIDDTCERCQEKCAHRTRGGES